MAALAVSLLLLCGCLTPPGYLLKQGRYLLQYSWGARDIDALLASASTPSDTRDFLLRVKEIKRFGVERIGLRENASYTRYKEIDRNSLASVVSACDAVSFTPHNWEYPVLGKLPYMGFYERPDAEAEAARLREEGYDVIIREVEAFSTLGFLRDPLYSFMKRSSDFHIASLLMHEQTHATLFVKGQAQFNEELATFVGEEGAFAWLREKHGANSPKYRAAVDERADSESFLAFVRELARALDEIYRGPLSREEKLVRKREIIDSYRERFAAETRPLFRSEPYRRMADPRINNAWLSLYALYTDDIPLLRFYWERRCGSDLRRFLEAARKLAAKGDVRDLMRRALENSAE